MIKEALDDIQMAGREVINSVRYADAKAVVSSKPKRTTEINE